jgi:2'-5' RNA ligase
MGFAVEMHFDRQAEARIRALWDELARQGIRSSLPTIGSRPHISLAVFDRLDPSRVGPELERMAGRTASVPLTLCAVGSFPTQEGVVFLAPVVTQDLLELHRRVHCRIDEMGLRPLEHYRPGRWVPHCTVAIDLPREQVPLALDICRGSRAFGPALLAEIGLVQYRPVRPICSFPLRDGC